MSLYKIPVIAFLSLEFKSILTPPHAPPAKDEVVQSTAIDVANLRKYRLAFTRIGQLTFAMAEIITIAALAFPSSRISQTALSFLIFKSGDPTRIQLGKISLLGAFLWICGSRMRKWTFRELGRFFRFDISIQKDHELVMTGPYAYVRHPSYTGMLLANLGWAFWTFAPGSWMRECGILETNPGRMALLLYIIIGLLPTSVVTLSRMSKEDAALRKRFGSQWEEWNKRVPYAIIPGIY